MKQHKPWFDEEWSKLLDHRKHAKLQWLQNPTQTNEKDKLNYVKRKNSRTIRNKKRECVKYTYNELETNSKNKNISLKRVTKLVPT
jgi:hypothetical protein